MASAAMKALALAATFHAVQASFGVCKDSTCGDCPVSTTDEGTGYPNCVVYNTADVFGNLFEQNQETGKWDVWFDIPAGTDRGDLCYYLIKTPASIGRDNCGVTKWTGQDAVCRPQSLEDTFMLQFCCGFGDCRAAGVPGLPGKRDDLETTVFSLRSNPGGPGIEGRAAGGGGGLYLVDPDGKVIPPKEVGPSTNARRQDTTEFTHRRNVLQSRDRCKKNSWVDESEEYITTAPGTQQVSGIVDGGAEGSTITITTARSSSWSTTIEANLGFADVLSLGVSFSTTFSETVEDSESREFPVPKGQRGYVGFTPFLLCKTGHGECDGTTVSGDVCTGYSDNNGIAGEYAVVVTG